MTPPSSVHVAWRSRITGHGEIAPESLIPHHDNFRRHGGAQLDALRGSLDTLGWVRTVLVSRDSGRVLDGHARVEQAIARGEKTVPVTIVDVTEDEERLILATLDPMTRMAYEDKEALKALVESTTSESAAITSLLTEMGKQAAVVPDREPVGGDLEPNKLTVSFKLIVTCASEAGQGELCAELESRGHSVRMVMDA